MVTSNLANRHLSAALSLEDHLSGANNSGRGDLLSSSVVEQNFEAALIRDHQATVLVAGDLLVPAPAVHVQQDVNRQRVEATTHGEQEAAWPPPILPLSEAESPSRREMMVEPLQSTSTATTEEETVNINNENLEGEERIDDNQGNEEAQSEVNA